MADIYAKPGEYFVLGTDQDDIIFGNEEDNQIEGGLGNDILTGGAGSDRFVLYYSGGGIDRITDFRVGEDEIKLTTAPHILNKYNLFTVDSQTFDSTFVRAFDDFLLYNQPNTAIIKGTDIVSSEYKSDKIVFGIDSVVADLERLPSYLSYDTNTGALYYLQQQIAWLPSGLVGF